MSSNGPKYGQLDHFFGYEPSVAFSLYEAVAKGKKAVLLTNNDQKDAARAREMGLSLLGLNSFGIAAPHQGINHCLSLSPILPGRIAFVTQSGSLGASILDWAHQHQVGFSRFIALGEQPTITLGECLDYLPRIRTSSRFCFTLSTSRTRGIS